MKYTFRKSNRERILSSLCYPFNNLLYRMKTVILLCITVESIHNFRVVNEASFPLNPIHEN